MGNIKTHKDLKVYQLSFEAGMAVYDLTMSFPMEELYSLTDQIRRSSRSFSGNLAEAWRKRDMRSFLFSKINDCEGEACGDSCVVRIRVACEYITKQTFLILYTKNMIVFLGHLLI